MNDKDNFVLEAYRTFDFEVRKDEILGKFYDKSKDNRGNRVDDERTWVIREVTVRSVMGEFGGNAGLFEIHKKRGDDGNEGKLLVMIIIN